MSRALSGRYVVAPMLRGKAVPMDRLAPKLIRRAMKKSYIAIVIDPIYKVITGDENSADQMASFCNQFDKICTELGCSVIYCHHHSKGQQGQKRAMDRASGSGVFARDPDALLDLLQLEASDDAIKQMQNKAVCAACIEALEQHVEDWRDHVSQDHACSSVVMMGICKELLPPKVYAEHLIRTEQIRSRVGLCTAWRIDGTLREFPRFKPVNIWFDYPVHSIDDGCLEDAKYEGTSNWRDNFSRKKPSQDRKGDRKASLEMAFEACSEGGKTTIKDLSEYLGVSEKTVRNRVKEVGGFWIDGGEIGKKSQFSLEGKEGKS